MAGIGRYEIVEQIGEGGMGTVYKAEQPTLKKTVALKVLSDFCARDEELLARFKREARIMAALPDYSHVVQVYDLDEAEGKWFYTMEYIPFSLAEHIGEGEAATDRTRVRRSTPRALPVEETQGIIEQILKGLMVIHDAGVVHRDICPRNVLLAKDGVARTVKVTDFGIAGRHGSHLTRTGMSGMGKEIYAAPEQEESLSHADARSDLYSVGVLAYRLVTGRLPKGRWKDPNVLNTDVSHQFNDWILKLLEQEPEDRFDRARAALDVLPSHKTVTDYSLPPTFQSTPHSPKHRFRSTSKTVSHDHFILEFGLGDDLKPKQFIQNYYVDNGDGTITDRATRLIWQQSGSDDELYYYDAKTYIDELNHSRYAGYSDWRLPTIPELMSLLEPTKKNGDLYIDPVFDNKLYWCWSADGRDSGSACTVSFHSGRVGWSHQDPVRSVRAVRTGQ